MSNTASYLGMRPGGRSEEVRRRVLDATAEELLESGFDRFSVTRVAARAGVHHTTIYRRWPTKSRLVLDAVIEFARGHVRPPQTGSLRLDLCEYFRSVAAAFADPRFAALARALIAVGPEEFAEERREYWADRIKAVNTMFGEAEARGEVIAPADRLHVAELISGPLWMRTLITDTPVDEAYIERLVDDALGVIEARPHTSTDAGADSQP